MKFVPDTHNYMTERKDGKCACSDHSTEIETDMTKWDKMKAHLKGDILCRPLCGREYYYLMFGWMIIKKG